MQNWQVLFDHFDLILDGLWKTLLLFFISLILSSIIGITSIFLLEGNKKNPLRRLLTWSIDIMRMLPFLIFVYLLYYGLPSFDIRLNAWTVGIIGLAVYHGAYFAEILRGLRVVLPQGQIDAALAHGYSKNKMMLFLILPQLFLRGGPLFGNQLIYMLKDTAFLTIITVQELTSVAASFQAIYFIPVEAFITVLTLYWIISFCIEQCVKLIDKISISKGIKYE